MSSTNIEVISPNVQISPDFIETDYKYQTSQVKRTATGKYQVSFFIFVFPKKSVKKVNNYI